MFPFKIAQYSHSFLIFSLVNASAYDTPPTININIWLLRTFPRTGSCNPCSLRCFSRVSQNPWETPIYSILYMVFNVCGQTVINVVWIVFQSHKREQQESSLVLIVMHPMFIFFNKLKRIPFFANAKLAKFCIIYKRWKGRVPSYLTSLLAVTGETRSR